MCTFTNPDCYATWNALTHCYAITIVPLHTKNITPVSLYLQNVLHEYIASMNNKSVFFVTVFTQQIIFLKAIKVRLHTLVH